MFNSDRFSLARRRRGFTKKSLAEALGVDQKTVIRYESGESEPSEPTLARLSEVLDFPEAFFFGEDFDEPTADGASFRSFTTMLARDREAALAAGALAFMLDDRVIRRFHLPKCLSANK
jgi:transcriptional regulator with XRE-family HTH domain